MKRLELISSSQPVFILPGARTALTEFYLKHRSSEDLDFFSEKEFNFLPLDTFIKKLKSDLDVKKVDFQQSFNRNIFFLHFNNEVLKIEFTYFPFSRIAKGEQKYGIDIDSLLDIATNKLFIIYQRSQARDYIDLYYICSKNSHLISDLIKQAKIKFDWHIDPLQLGTQFTKSIEVKDFPRMTEKLDDKIWQDFFILEAKKLSSEIIK